ncbi:MAG: DnaA/Hda family protein, partial [Planctomycetota bacterium]
MAHEVNQSEKDIAEELRSALVSRIGPERMDLWIPTETSWSYDVDQLKLGFENSFSCELAQKMLASEIAGHLRDLDGDATKLVFEVSPSSQNAPTSSAVSTSTPVGRPNRQPRRQPETPRHLQEHDRTDFRVPADEPQSGNRIPAKSSRAARKAKSVDFSSREVSVPSEAMTAEGSWQQFIEGESNQLAYVAAKMVVTQQGGMTPLFLHGPSGVGKSLLVAGIAEQLRTVQRLRRVTLMTSEQFLNDFTDGLRRGGLPMFRRKYRGVEALVIEDIQFFAGKKSSLTEVKNTLDNLLRAGKQVIFTADRSLNDLRPLGAELIARL